MEKMDSKDLPRKERQRPQDSCGREATGREATISDRAWRDRESNAYRYGYREGFKDAKEGKEPLC